MPLPSATSLLVFSAAPRYSAWSQPVFIYPLIDKTENKEFRERLNERVTVNIFTKRKTDDSPCS